MLADILAGLGVVGGVNARGDASRRNGSKVGKEPRGRIEPDDVDRVKFVTAQRQ